MPDVPELAARLLLGVLLLAVVDVARAIWTRQLLVPRPPRRTLQFDWAVLAGALLIISLNIIPLVLRLLRVESRDEAARPSQVSIDQAILIPLTFIAILFSLIVARGKNRLSDYGIELRGWHAEVRFGVLGWLVSLPLCMAVILIVGSFRSQETLNPILILLRQTNSDWTIVKVIVAGVITAPLAEELVFRVVFQGLLETRLRPVWSIAIPALVFAGMHGPYDALPLVPLALVLGLLYHLRHSYVAVVTTHALFNATFLILAIWQRTQI